MKPHRLYPAGSKNPEKGRVLNELRRVVDGKRHIVDQARQVRENGLFADQRNFVKGKCRKCFNGINGCATMASAKRGTIIVAVFMGGRTLS